MITFSPPRPPDINHSALELHHNTMSSPLPPSFPPSFLSLSLCLCQLSACLYIFISLYVCMYMSISPTHNDSCAWVEKKVTHFIAGQQSACPAYISRLWPRARLRPAACLGPLPYVSDARSAGRGKSTKKHVTGSVVSI